ncbi:ABC transporter ATP-binding protein [Corynebacterium coyleae]|uniref:ABC transporter ATP-binding protein n=1 Tax=Corynebacterium coyleae TaxID=53374 RepID=UPI00254C65B7|nr:ATP-binding cassette domain-containing protein [Corynebacterium coyleae]MDK8241431.1 ATP-binding cassette domain-containing protein [Corynebacterium coyleae]
MSQSNNAQKFATPSVVLRNIVMDYPVKSTEKRFGWDKLRALNDINLVAYEGQSIGFFGQNGSGKSTTMRVIAGAERPSKGEVLVKSQPTLMGVRAALQPRLSGAKNVRIGCLAMGMTPAEVESAYPGIVELADIGDAINRPMETYSSGQRARLGFSIGLATDPDILIVDETLSTGDAAFAKRAAAHMEKVLSGAGTVLIVSHSAKQLEDMCDRGVWIHEGEIIADGGVSDVADRYRAWVRLKGDNKSEEAEKMIEDVYSSYVKPSIVFTDE